MPDSIIDGAGGGKRVKVTDDNELLVLATTRSEEHLTSSRDGQSYFANTADTANTLTATATGGIILYLENTSSTQDIVVEKVLSSASVAGGIMVWKCNTIIGTIGNNNIHTPLNLNFGSPNTAPVICHNWDEVGDGMTGITGGAVIKSFITGIGFTEHPINGAMIIPKASNLTIEYSVAGGGEFECGIRFYLDIK